MAADTCRLCLRPIDQAKSSDLLTETTKLAMLKEFLPEMNLDITENTEVCNNCMEELETSFNFKNGVVVNEANIQAKLEGKKQKKIDLKLMLDDVAKKELKKSDYICRTCLSICKSPSISLFDSPSNMMPYSFVKKMCEVVFELELIASAKPVLCDDCWETLQTVYNFRKSCLRTDERLRIYVGTKNVTKLSIGDFKKFAEENPVKDEDEDFSDEELDGYVKDEPIDEEELKIDPEEASCSSSSVKVKQETEVKSESELNSDDEVKEDEPELLDPKAVKSEADGLDGGDCKMEIGDVKVDAEGGDVAGTSGQYFTATWAKDIIYAVGDHSNQSGLLQYRSDKMKRLCPYTNSRKGELKQHLESHEPNFERQTSLLDQIFQVDKVTHEMETLSCSQCAYKTIVKSNFRIHQETHKPDSERKMFTCGECSMAFKKKRSLLDHKLRVHKGTYEMKRFSCSHCPYKTIHKTNFRGHQETHKANSERRLFICGDCAKEFTKKLYLLDHMVRVHKRPPEMKMFSCSHCSYTTVIKNKFRAHQDTHKANSERKVFTCGECAKEFIRKSSLLDHILRVHKITHGIKRFSCSHCPYKTTKKTVFENHQEIHKPESKRQLFTCTECSKEYKQKCSLLNHTLRVHKIIHGMKAFSCSYCPYETINKSNYRAHQETHKGNSERRVFTCGQCAKELTRKSTLLEHIQRVHSGTYEMKTFSCSHCLYETINKSNYRAHQETHKRNSERRVFTCGQCSKELTRKSSLLEHILRVHK